MQFLTEETKDSAAWGIRQRVQASLINLHTPHTCPANACLCSSTRMVGEIWDELACKNILYKKESKALPFHCLCAQTSPPSVYNRALQSVHSFHWGGCF